MHRLAGAFLGMVALGVGCGERAFDKVALEAKLGQIARVGAEQRVSCASIAAQRPLVVLVIGQSNAANHGVLAQGAAQPVVLVAEGQCILAVDPLPGGTGRGASIWQRLPQYFSRLEPDKPLVLAVMGGSVYFAGNLLPRLRFPIEFDFIHASRYGDASTAGSITWRAEPRDNVKNRVVLVLDDILDGGDTLFAVRERVIGLGAKACYTAVLTDKNTGNAKPIHADFVGISIPDRFVFGCGMDAHGAWRNLPAIYAMKGS